MTPVVEALHQVATIGIDTAPFISLIERSPSSRPPARAIFQRISAGAMQGRTSVMTPAGRQPVANSVNWRLNGD